jgi:hypothetical protein
MLESKRDMGVGRRGGGSPPDQTISLRRPRLETQTPPFPPSSCRDLGLDPLIKIRPLSLQSDGDAGSGLSILTASPSRLSHGYSKAVGRQATEGLRQ